MIVVLALVLAAIYGVYRLMKKASRPKTADSSAVRLLASTSLGPGKALHVVSLGTKAFLIGATDNSVNLVSEIDDKEFVDALVLEAQTAVPLRPDAGRDFGNMLASLIGGGRKQGAKKQRSASAKAEGDFLAGQRERLRKF
jgi:flagellar protein FliO/FliZ